ncbi:MAG: nitroreductase family protein [Dermatophilus congolensis]|nr:nitroreductase family protein [Dermatophilus congolensis]
MDVTEALRRRRMCRDFDPAASVPRDTLSDLLDLALRAPSAGFSQGTSFVVLDTTDDRDAFWRTATALSGRSEGGARPNAWLRGVGAAPVLIAVCADPSRYTQRYARPDKTHPDSDPAAWPTPFWDVDAGMAVMSLLVGAEAAGLGALFFGVPAQAHSAVGDLLDITEPIRLIGMVALGAPRPPDDSPRGGPRTRSNDRPRREPFEARVRFGVAPSAVPPPVFEP